VGRRFDPSFQLVWNHCVAVAIGAEQQQGTIFVAIKSISAGHWTMVVDHVDRLRIGAALAAGRLGRRSGHD